MPSENAYSQPVTLKNVLKFAVPTIVMTVFMSFYTMIDGLFVSNLLGTDALSAINLSAPIISLVTAVSTMLATGGSAVIMKKAGEGKIEEARRDFTFLILVNIGVGILMSLLGYALMDKIFAGMGLSQKVFDYCHAYLSRYLLFTVPILLMNNFTLYMIASGRSTLSMLCSITGGFAPFHLGRTRRHRHDQPGMPDGHCGRCHCHRLGIFGDCRGGNAAVFQSQSTVALCQTRTLPQNVGASSSKRQFGDGDCSGHWHREPDVQLDDAALCR